MQTTMKISSSAAATLVMAKLSAPQATVKIIMKLQQFKALIAIIVALNCLKVNLAAQALDLADDQATLQRVKQIRQICIARTGLTHEQQRVILDHRLFTSTSTLANTPREIQCYCLCYLNESNIFINDKPNVEFLRSTLPLLINDAAKANAVLDKCLKLEGKNNCEIALNFELCVIKDTGLYV